LADRKAIPTRPFSLIFSILVGLEIGGQRNGVLCFEEVSVGNSIGTIIDIKGIVRTAILVGAEILVFIHNHPSGDPSPSQGDKDVTKRLVKACQIFDLEVLDHIVIGDGGFSSLKGMGEL
jgi:DNA repair protein RadC